jgi:hypothetical protein
MAKLYDSEGTEVTAYLPEELDTKVSEAVKAKETEFSTKEKTLQEELAGAKKALGDRAEQFSQFRKLNDEQKAKLTEVERINYENTLALNKQQEERAEFEKKNKENMIESVIRSKAGTDEKLFTKMKGMWEIFGVEANTPEQMEQKSRMILGAIGQSEPDLLASVAGFSNGSFAPPPVAGEKKEEDKTFADTPKGKAIANELGLKLEPDKKK